MRSFCNHSSRFHTGSHNDSLFIIHTFFIFDLRGKSCLQQGNFNIVDILTYYSNHFHLFCNFFLLGLFLIFSGRTCTKFKQTKSLSYKEKYDTTDNDGRNNCQDCGQTFHLRIIIILVILFLRLIIFILFVFFLHYIFLLGRSSLLNCLLHVLFFTQVHGFFHCFLLLNLTLDLGYFLIAYHFGSPVFIRIRYSDKILIRIHQRTLQICYQFCHGLVSSVRALLTTFKHNLLYADRYLRNIVPGRWHLLLDMLNSNCNSGFTVKRYTSRDHFKHSDTQRINITLFIRKSASCLFR